MTGKKEEYEGIKGIPLSAPSHYPLPNPKNLES